jgi:hypothetical protein
MRSPGSVAASCWPETRSRWAHGAQSKRNELSHLYWTSCKEEGAKFFCEDKLLLS